MRGASTAAVCFAAALAAGGLFACASSSDTDGAGGAAASSCVSAPACPDGGVPSYKTDIAPIIQATCIKCHGPTGTAGFYMTTYPEVFDQFGSILSQVTVCQMPPLNGPVMTDAQRVALTAWLRCGAPDN